MLVRYAADTDLPALLRLYRQLNPLAVAPTHPEGAWAAMRALPGVTVYVAEENGAVAATCTLIVTPNLRMTSSLFMQSRASIAMARSWS